MRSSNTEFEASVCIRGRPVKEVHHRGHTYIEGRKGSEYTLRFRNNRCTRVLVIPSVDGLCVADGKPAGRESSGFIVERNETIDIPGWIVDDNTAAKFTFWPQDARGEKTYVEELHREGANVDPGNQGLIGFMVIEEKTKPTISYSHPYIEPKPRRDDSWNPWKSPPWPTPPFGPGPYWEAGNDTFDVTASASGGMRASNSTYGMADTGPLGTKFGDAQHFSTRIENFERGKVVAELVLEYDTLRGLKDRGVPVELFKGSKKKYSGRSAFPADSGVGCKPPRHWRK